MTRANLSERERMVFLGLGSGRSCTEIANDIYLSVKTVSTYRVRALKKLGMKTNQEIVAYCVANGLA